MNEVHFKCVLLCLSTLERWFGFTKTKIRKHSTISNSSTIIKVCFQLRHTTNTLGQYNA